MKLLFALSMFRCAGRCCGVVLDTLYNGAVKADELHEGSMNSS